MQQVLRVPKQPQTKMKTAISFLADKTHTYTNNLFPNRKQLIYYFDFQKLTYSSGKSVTRKSIGRKLSPENCS